MLYSGVLTAQQADDIYTAAAGGSGCGAKRFLTLGSPGIGGATIATPTPYARSLKSSRFADPVAFQTMAWEPEYRDRG